MQIRPSQIGIFQRVQTNLLEHLGKLARSQEQVATGKRILRPSDDATGAGIALLLRRQVSEVSGYRAAAQAGRPFLEGAVVNLQEGSSMLQKVREDVMLAMTGTMSNDDRVFLAEEIESLREGLLDVANARWGDRFLFAGTATSDVPFVEVAGGEGSRTAYRGTDAHPTVTLGTGVEVEIGQSGEFVFGGGVVTSVSLEGVSGARVGPTANFGSGYQTLRVRHDVTSGALGAGLAFAGGGVDDTLLGARDLTVDSVAGTVQLGTGPALAIPDPASAEATDFVVKDADGSELHLDFTGYTGVDFSGTVQGDGSLSLDGVAWTAIDFVATDLELVHGTDGAVLHVDTTTITRASDDVVVFEGSANLFDTLTGLASDLRRAGEFTQQELNDRIGARLSEFDRGYDQLISSLTRLGSRAVRLDGAEARLSSLELELKGRLSLTEDADLAETALEMARTQQSLEVVQAAGARLLQQTLLNYL